MLGRFAGALECQLLHFSISHFDHEPELKRSTAWPSAISLPLASAAHIFARASALWLLAYPAFQRALAATRLAALA